MVPELNSPLVCSLSGGFSEKGDVYYFWLLRVVRLLTHSRGINWLGHRIFRGVTGKRYKKPPKLYASILKMVLFNLLSKRYWLHTIPTSIVWKYIYLQCLRMALSQDALILLLFYSQLCYIRGIMPFFFFSLQIRYFTRILDILLNFSLLCYAVTLHCFVPLF